MEERVPNGTEVRCIDTGEVYKIADAIETDNRWLLGVYLYLMHGQLHTGFGLYRSEFLVDV